MNLERARRARAKRKKADYDVIRDRLVEKLKAVDQLGGETADLLAPPKKVKERRQLSFMAMNLMSRKKEETKGETLDGKLTIMFGDNAGTDGFNLSKLETVLEEDAPKRPAAPERRLSIDKRLQIEKAAAAAAAEAAAFVQKVEQSVVPEDPDAIRNLLKTVFEIKRVKQMLKKLEQKDITSLIELQMMKEIELSKLLDLDGGDTEILYDALSSTFMNNGKFNGPASPPPSPPHTPALRTGPEEADWFGPASPAGSFLKGITSFFTPSRRAPIAPSNGTAVPDRMEVLMQKHASIILQKWTRGMNARAEAERQQWAATLINKAVRGYNARSDYINKVVAAETIQSLARGRKERNNMNQKQVAATKVESLVRGRQNRKVIATQHKAATQVQAAKRALEVRKERKKEAQAATLISSRMRARIVKSKMNEYRAEVDEYNRRPSFTGKVVESVGKPKPPGNCCAQWWHSALGMHTLLLLCRPPSKCDIDGRWLDDPYGGRLSDPQAVQVVYAVISFDALAVGLAYAYADIWEPLVGSIGFGTPSELWAHIIIIAAAAFVCLVGTLAIRLVFRAANAATIKLTGPILPDDGKAQGFKCNCATVVALLGWVVCLGGSIASCVYFLIITMDLQQHEMLGKAYDIFMDTGIGIGVAWVVLEPLAIGVKACCIAQSRKRKKAKTSEAGEAPAAAPAADEIAMTVLEQMGADDGSMKKKKKEKKEKKEKKGEVSQKL